MRNAKNIGHLLVLIHIGDILLMKSQLFFTKSSSRLLFYSNFLNYVYVTSFVQFRGSLEKLLTYILLFDGRLDARRKEVLVD